MKSDTAAFATGATTSAFLGRRTGVSTCTLARPHGGVTMMAKGDGPFGIKISNPFANVFDDEKKAQKEAAAPKKGVSLPVSSGKSTTTTGLSKPVTDDDEDARGLRLLAQDLLKNLPEASGVGRQDVSTYMKPQFGDPGYKPQAYEKVSVSKLGISTFSDDPNYVGKVGGLEAVKEAAKQVEKGATPKAIKTGMMKKEEIKIEEEKVYPLPDYLMPLPEDTPRKGMTWKNYLGR